MCVEGREGPYQTWLGLQVGLDALALKNVNLLPIFII